MGKDNLFNISTGNVFNEKRQREKVVDNQMLHKFSSIGFFLKTTH